MTNELTNRMTNVLDEDEDSVPCPNCGTFNSRRKKSKGLDIFPTTRCISCKHEWIVKDRSI